MTSDAFEGALGAVTHRQSSSNGSQKTTVTQVWGVGTRKLFHTSKCELSLQSPLFPAHRPPGSRRTVSASIRRTAAAATVCFSPRGPPRSGA